jgi:hypothetical protein
VGFYCSECSNFWKFTFHENFGAEEMELNLIYTRNTDARAAIASISAQDTIWLHLFSKAAVTASSVCDFGKLAVEIISLTRVLRITAVEINELP